MGAIRPTPSAIQAIIDNEKANRKDHQERYGGPHPVSCNVCAGYRKRITALLRQKRDAETTENRIAAGEAVDPEGFLSRMAAAAREHEQIPGGPPAADGSVLGRKTAPERRFTPLNPADAGAIPGETPVLYKTIDYDSGDPVFTVQLVVQAHKGAQGINLLDQFEEACKANGWDILAGRTEEKKQ